MCFIIQQLLIHFQIFFFAGIYVEIMTTQRVNERKPAWLLRDILQELEAKAQNADDRYLTLAHDAGHAEMVDGDSLISTESLNRRQIISLRRTFKVMWDPAEQGFNKTNGVMNLDPGFSGRVTRETQRLDRSVEISASVGMNQAPLDNASNLARLQNKTLT